MKLAPSIRNSNNNNQNRFEEKKRERDKLVMQEGNDKMTDLMIDRLIYPQALFQDRKSACAAQALFKIGRAPV